MSRVVAATLLIAVLSYGGYLYWQHTHPAPVVTAPAGRARRFSPPGVFSLTRYRSVTSAVGVTGFPPGTKVTLVREEGGKRRVSNGSVEFDADTDELTNDLGVATRFASGDAHAQAQISKMIASQTMAISILQATYGCSDRAIDVTHRGFRRASPTANGLSAPATT